MSKQNEEISGRPIEEPYSVQEQSVEEATGNGWRETFRLAFEKARKDSRPTNRSALGRDHSRSLWLLAAAAVAVVLLFFVVFSSPNRSGTSAKFRRPGTPNLGQPAHHAQQTEGLPGSVTPLLSAQNAQADAPQNNDVSAADVDRTARPTPSNVTPPLGPSTTTQPQKAGTPALGQIDFSVPARSQPAPSTAVLPKHEPEDLRKTSIVFVRSAQNVPPGSAASEFPVAATSSATLRLPVGTKLVARLESVVTSAVKEPVSAAVEYNYERDGEIVVPAGAKAIGNLEQADRSGSVEIRFDSLEMPDGTTEKIDATAMSLTYGPLKGKVSGKKTATNFLVRTFTGLGQAATYLVGSGGLSAPLDESAFLRDRIATNIGIAGDQELNNLTSNQNVVVTLEGNTRFYIVLENGQTPTPSQPQSAPAQTTRPAPPTAEELRELLELQREMSAVYQQPPPTTAQASDSQ